MVSGFLDLGIWAAREWGYLWESFPCIQHLVASVLQLACITIDVGNNNKELLNDEFYIGLRRRRAMGQEYAELLHEFMCAVKQNYGEKVLIQFEDFANHIAFDLLAKYGSTHLVFNDDIQGTSSVLLSGLMAGLNLVGGTLANHTFLFLGAGEAGTGVAELIALMLWCGLSNFMIAYSPSFYYVISDMRKPDVIC